MAELKKGQCRGPVNPLDEQLRADNGQDETHHAGDHVKGFIAIGHITRIFTDEDFRRPLLFYASAYRKMDMEATYE